MATHTNMSCHYTNGNIDTLKRFVQPYGTSSTAASSLPSAALLLDAFASAKSCAEGMAQTSFQTIFLALAITVNGGCADKQRS